MIGVLLLLAVNVAFPREGAELPSVTNCYFNGAVSPGATNLTVNKSAVRVHDQGGWVTMVPLEAGENVIVVSNGEEMIERKVKVAAKVEKSAGAPVKKTYGKLEFAADCECTNRTQVVYLDAGHGGEDTGAVSPHNLPEKDANLKMAKAVKAELEGMGIVVKMTRDKDVAVPLYDRPKAAHREKAGAFVSIHHNAPPFEKDPYAMRYHCVYAWNSLGEGLARAINHKMAAELKDELKNNGVLHANYAVTRSPEIPSCLIEVDFLTTPEGELDCWNVDRRRRIARAIAKGIVEFIKNKTEADA